MVIAKGSSKRGNVEIIGWMRISAIAVLGSQAAVPDPAERTSALPSRRPESGQAGHGPIAALAATKNWKDRLPIADIGSRISD
jgi:hypothetical protein